VAATDEITPEARGEALSRLRALCALLASAGVPALLWPPGATLKAAIEKGTLLQIVGAIDSARKILPHVRDGGSIAFAVHFDGALNRIARVASGWVFGTNMLQVERQVDAHVRALVDPDSTHRAIVELEEQLAQMLPRDDAPDPGDPKIAENPARRRARP
jgi:hypothetical protein